MLASLLVAGTTLLSGYLGARAQRKAAHAATAQQSASLMRQGALYDAQGGMYLQSARLSADTAASMIAVAKANARDYGREAARVDATEARQLEETVKERQQTVGRGLVGFAANGVLLSDSIDSAAARWEQDEASDAAYQQLLVMQDAEDRIYALGIEAKNALAQGYGAAAQAYGQAMGQASSAYGAYLSGRYAREDAEDAERYGNASARTAYRYGLLSAGLGALASGMGVYASHYTPSGASMPQTD